jgi:hypothetical protein
MRDLALCTTAVLSIVLTAACSSGPAANGTSTEPGRGANVPFTTIVQASMPGQTGGERREVVRDAAGWEALWGELHQGSGAVPPLPAVDFSREMVIAAAMETQSCVSRVTIRAVTQAGRGLVVDLLEAPPAPNCVCVVAERPIHVVRLARLSGTVRFTAERGVTSCG